jgi:hypothetical protein
MPNECSLSGDAFNDSGRTSGRFGTRTKGLFVNANDPHLNDIMNPDPAGQDSGTIKREQFWTVDSGPGKTSSLCKNPQVGAYFKGPRVTSEQYKTVDGKY